MSDKKGRGRPPSEDPASHVVRVRMTSGQRLDLRRVAQENGTGLSGIIREAVNEFVSDYRETGIFRRHNK